MRAFAAISGQQNIVTSLVAFAWIAFGLLTIAKIFGLMEYAAIHAAGTSTGPATAGAFHEKTAATPTTAQPAAGAGPGAAV